MEASSSKAKLEWPKNKVWEYYIEGERNSEGHASAKCNFCQVRYSRAEVELLKGHLANHCLKASGNIIRKYQNMFEQKAINGNNKKRKTQTGQTSISDFHDKDEPLP